MKNRDEPGLGVLLVAGLVVVVVVMTLNRNNKIIDLSMSSQLGDMRFCRFQMRVLKRTFYLSLL